MLDAVWAGTIVDESVLSKSIGELRVALDDSFRAPQLIATVQRRGFRFIAPVSVEPPASASDAHESASEKLSVLWIACP